MERISIVNVETAGIMRGDVGERRGDARIALDRDDALGAFDQQRAREPAGAGPHLYNRAPLERPCGACDPPRQVQVEDEVLAEALLGPQAQRADDIAQRRQSVGARARPGLLSRFGIRLGMRTVPRFFAAHVARAEERAAAISAASFKLAMKLSADAEPCAAISNAVP